MITGSQHQRPESSVSRILCPPVSRRATVIHLGPPLPATSSDLPGSGRGASHRERDGRPAIRSPIWSCSAWGLPCLTPSPVERCALTAPFHPYRPDRGPAGGMFSVALSVASPRLAVSEHAARRSPDFPLPARSEKRPSGTLRRHPFYCIALLSSLCSSAGEPRTQVCQGRREMRVFGIRRPVPDGVSPTGLSTPSLAAGGPPTALRRVASCWLQRPGSTLAELRLPPPASETLWRHPAQGALHWYLLWHAHSTSRERRLRER